jgi:hypothetical protein
MRSCVGAAVVWGAAGPDGLSGVEFMVSSIEISVDVAS